MKMKNALNIRFQVLSLALLALVFSGCSSAPKKQVSSAATQEMEAAANPNGPTGAPEEKAPLAEEGEQQGQVVPAGPPSDVMYTRFNNARARKDWQASVDAAGEILSRNPTDIKVMNGLACLAIDGEKYDLARLYLAKVLEKEPNNGAALNNMGVVEMKSDNLRLALINFKKATESDPRGRAAHANLGTIYLQYRNYLNAASELEAAVDNGDQSPATLSNLGFAKAGAGDYDRARSAYEKALSKEGGNVSIMLNYAVLLVNHTNDKSQAIRLLNKIRFVGHEPAILNKVEALLRKAEGIGFKGKNGSTGQGELE